MSSANATSEQIKADILLRLRRISGQITGIASMIENGKECADILTQVKAARQALKSMNVQVMRRYLLTCHVDMDAQTPAEREKAREELIATLARFMD
jgi:CsoR family transcriptional regulator, copper-sensing transcriptional repressor